MDNSQTVILISIFNILFTGLIGGVVIYVIQKKIDASIQKSLFEYQIKFSRSYPKTLEGIEIFNQKFLVYRELWHELSERIPQFKRAKKFRPDASDKEKEIDEQEKKVNSSLLELNIWFQNNRLHLPEQIKSELDDIIGKADTLFQLLIAARYFSDAPNPYLAKLLNNTARREDLEMKAINPEGWMSVDLYIGQLSEQVIALSVRLENLYKSVADAQ